MVEAFRTRRTRAKAAVALVLAFAAGCVDIIGYLSFGHVFTAHLTGNTICLGQGIIETRRDQAAKAAIIIAVFVIGTIVGRTIIEIGSRRAMRSVAMTSLLLEAALIAVVVPSVMYSPMSLAAAMGVQTATLT
jgi:uncharacterized membrane protein YoaK (UPF0700 family)